MYSLKKIAAVMLLCNIAPKAFASDRLETLKTEVVNLAKSYFGKVDPDLSLQQSFEPYIQQLLVENPMPPVADRVQVLDGTWKQEWGPYKYGSDVGGGIDPEIGIAEIYQVVSKEGYYYNVSPIFKNGNVNDERIGLLRGEFSVQEGNFLTVKFTDYPGVKPRPSNMPIWNLPALAEAGTLSNRITIVPSFIVRLVFGGGSLEEVYTDSTLRILYGQSGNGSSPKRLYVMSRVL